MWKKEKDWFWEGNVQDKIARHLEKQGYSVTTTQTLYKSRGVDIVAQRNSEELLIEVKGYPSDKYVDGNKQGQPKKTKPTLQARHWLSDVIFSIIRRKNKSPKSNVAIGLPEHQRYLELLEEARWAFNKLGINIFVVTQTGEVYKK